MPAFSSSSSVAAPSSANQPRCAGPPAGAPRPLRPPISTPATPLSPGAIPRPPPRSSGFNSGNAACAMLHRRPTSVRALLQRT
eukprot:1865091-Pleurochrysis_carterae.AAC.1